jgi:hypothetical protein
MKAFDLVSGVQYEYLRKTIAVPTGRAGEAEGARGVG